MTGTLRSIGTACFVVLVLTLGGCGDEGGGNGGGGVAAAMEGAASPEELSERLMEAGKSENLGAIARLVYPDDRPMLTMAVSMVPMLLPMMKQMAEAMGGEAAGSQLETFEAAETEIKAAMEKHGIEESALQGIFGQMMAASMGGEDAAMPEPPESIKKVDHVAFLADVGDVFKKLSSASDKMDSPTDDMKSGLTEVKVDGDAGTAKMGNEDVKIVKHDGRWYVRIDELMK